MSAQDQSVIVGADAEFRPGQKLTLAAGSASAPYGAVFEDDGETGYFYALDTSDLGQRILDALHVYNVADLPDRHDVSTAQVVWSSDGLRVILRINGDPHAGFDFATMRGYCHTVSFSQGLALLGYIS